MSTVTPSLVDPVATRPAPSSGPGLPRPGAPTDAKPAAAALTPGADASPTRPTDTVELSDAALQQAGRADDTQGDADPTAPTGTDGKPLDDAEQKQVEELQARDREVRQHEQAHKAAAGSYATSGPTYAYQEGPDGKRYAVGGSVGIDTSPEATPEETIAKMQVVRRAALAPAEPSSQDRKVAAQASQTMQEARAALAQERTAEANADESDESDDIEAAGASTDSQATTNAANTLNRFTTAPPAYGAAGLDTFA
ncbi:MAG: putative metalloprotease CJM1_0395 family protein [Planctomycetota bacterium]